MRNSQKREKTIFEKIADREVPANIFWEDEKFMAFLDINPIIEGMTLVIPKKFSGDYIFDLEEDIYEEFFCAIKKVAKLIEKKLKPNRIAMAFEGFEIPHVHAKLYPVKDLSDFTIMRKKQFSEEDIKKTFQKLTE